MKKLKLFIFVLIPLIYAGLPPSKDVRKVASDIKEKKRDVGKEYGMEIGKRYHEIHSEILNINCEDCHIENYENSYLYQRKYKLPVRGAPGPVKREVCLNCHREGGVADTELYGKEK